MFRNRETTLARTGRDPFALLRQMTTDFDRLFGEAGWPALRSQRFADAAAWNPRIDVFEKDNRLVTKVDLPGLKKDDVKVEVTDGQLAISGERKSETEEKKDDFYRCEREYGSFYRAVPLPEGVKLEDVKASFADGVLEVSVPMPAKTVAPAARKVEIQDGAKAIKAAAA
ncbi:MAG: Spore protein [Acidobacteriota bacterium]|jgi:HSP20 family protein